MLDTISTGATIAFAMECFEHGLIGLDDTDGIDLRFGNAEAMLMMIERIAQRQGFGNLLAEGSKRAAEKIGGEAHFFAMQVKGQEFAMHDPAANIMWEWVCHLGDRRRPPGGDARYHYCQPGIARFQECPGTWNSKCATSTNFER